MKSLEGFLPDLKSVTPVPKLTEDTRLAIQDSLNEARNYLAYFEWITGIKSELLGVHFEGIISLFLFEIEAAREDVDRWIWVVVGDVPTAYITCEDAKDPFGAIDGYLGAMEDWVKAAREGASVANLIP